MARKNKKASERRESILKYIREFLVERGYPPSVREIGKAVGLKSSSTVHTYLNQLEDLGMIRRDPTKPRAIDILDEKPWSGTSQIPLIGAVAAGVPITAVENIEDVYFFPTDLLGTREATFMLRVKGESMINVGILDGDYIFVKQQDTANNGDIVVALVSGEDATVKRIYFEQDCVRLKPENDAMESFYEKDVAVLGKVIGVFRRI